MSAEEFIKNKLTNLVVEFPEIRARYDNDIDGTHVIEIVPNETYHNIAAFRIAEDGIIDEFIENYPFENIVFFAEDDEYKIRRVDFELAGRMYGVTPTVLREANFSYDWYNQLPYLNSSNIDYYPQIFNKCSILQNIGQQQPNLVREYNWHLSTEDYSVHGLVSIKDKNLTSNEIEPTYTNAEENNYALAA